MERLFQKIKYILLGVLFVGFPLFFLTTTQDFFITNKFYFLGFFAIVLTLVCAAEAIVTKKIIWVNKVLDLPILLFFGTVLLSMIVSSTNKVAAFTNPNVGVGVFLFLTIVYFYLSRNKPLSNKIYSLSALILSILTVFFFIQPLKSVDLPSSLEFIKNPSFTSLGSQLDLAIFLGFFLILPAVRILEKKANSKDFALAGINLVALLIPIFLIFKYKLMVLPPLSLSWYAVLDTMKNLVTALFGAGVNNFGIVFTKVKDIYYNQSPLWQIASFSVARIVPFHILTEMGIVGFVAFVFLLLQSGVAAFKQSLTNKVVIAYLVLIVLIFPPTLPLLFLAFFIIGLISASQESNVKKTFTFSEQPIFFVLILIAALIFIGSASYLLGRAYLAEYYFKKSIDGLTQNNAKLVYDNMRTARILNPYEERFVLNFSQTNLLIADSLATKKDITNQDRQTIAQAIQTAISEAKELIKLNPNNAQYFENLANVYKNIIPIASGSDVWAISAYQRAIVLDPANPTYRLNVGGIYYLLGQYANAVSFFEQAVALKPDWSNGYYNLAWSYFQNKQYDQAAATMQNVLTLINKDTDKTDWDKANADLAVFKEKLNSSQQQESSPSGRLNLPNNPVPSISPKITLPQEASPEAK
ncbi:tetratricopeptide repeat protein [Patescibacteria group bacterium]|nr:tetratricopeptide repeat protein [Patescibacteria group bacterium]